MLECFICGVQIVVDENQVEMDATTVGKLELLFGALKSSTDSLDGLRSTRREALYKELLAGRLDEDKYRLELLDVAQRFHALDVHLEDETSAHLGCIPDRALACSIVVAGKVGVLNKLVVFDHLSHLVHTDKVVFSAIQFALSGFPASVRNGEYKTIFMFGEKSSKQGAFA